MKAYLSISLLGLCVIAPAQISTGFDSAQGYTGSTSGTSVTGQGGWYNPVAGSADGLVYTYAGNGLGMAVNPNGNDQFLACISQGDPAYGRAQHDITLIAGKYTLSMDFCAMFNGALPASEYLGSVSLQPSASANYFQSLYAWDTNAATGDKFDANFGVFASTGGAITFVSAGADWTNLPLNHWFHETVTWDFVSNQITKVTLQDLTTGGQVFSYEPTDWYLAGGANNSLGLAMPTAMRCFGGGATVGNIMGYDNVSIQPASTTETLAPTGNTINLGKVSSGNLASLAADDGNALTVCKFIVPSQTSPIVRMTQTYTTTKPSPTAIELDVKAKLVNAGAFKIRGFQHNYSSSSDDQVIADTTLTLSYATYTGSASGTLTNYVGASNAMQTKVEIQQTGPSTVTAPCVSFEFINLKVSD